MSHAVNAKWGLRDGFINAEWLKDLRNVQDQRNWPCGGGGTQVVMIIYIET
jgi:hypothetical protein